MTSSGCESNHRSQRGSATVTVVRSRGSCGYEDSDEGEDTELYTEEIEVVEGNAETANEAGVTANSTEAAEELVTTFSEDDHKEHECEEIGELMHCRVLQLTNLVL